MTNTLNPNMTAREEEDKKYSDSLDQDHLVSGCSGNFFGVLEPLSESKNKPPLCHILESSVDEVEPDGNCVDLEQMVQIMSAISLESLIDGNLFSASGDSHSEDDDVLHTSPNVSASDICSFPSRERNSPLKCKSQAPSVSFPSEKKVGEIPQRRCKSVPPQREMAKGKNRRLESHKRREKSVSPPRIQSRQKGSKRKEKLESGYDPRFEKSHTYLHGQGKNFSKAKQYLSPARPGLQKLTVNYTQTNLENNYHKIFMDLVKSAHRKNILIDESTRKLERRLRSRREDKKRATSYYVNKGLKDPFRNTKKKQPARTVAEKKEERKQRIEKISEELKGGYTPKYKTMKTFTYEDMEKLKNCRYLRSYTDDY